MDASVRTLDHIVVQVGESIAQRDGCINVSFTQAQSDSFVSLQAQPNSGIVLNADGTLTALAASVPGTDPYAPDFLTVFNYMPVSGSAVSGLVTTFINSTTNDPALRATMAALRSTIRIIRGLAAST